MITTISEKNHLVGVFHEICGRRLSSFRITFTQDALESVHWRQGVKGLLSIADGRIVTVSGFTVMSIEAAIRARHWLRDADRSCNLAVLPDFFSLHDVRLEFADVCWPVLESVALAPRPAGFAAPAPIDADYRAQVCHRSSDRTCRYLTPLSPAEAVCICGRDIPYIREEIDSTRFGVPDWFPDNCAT